MLGLGLELNKSTLQGFETLVKSAGGVFYYDARKDLKTANGVTPDRSGKGNDVTWANFAGTGSSGLVVESGKVFRRLDGTDDFGSMVNTASIDITSAPLAVFMTIKYVTGSWIINKNSNSALNTQYGITVNSINKYIQVYLEGNSIVNTDNNSVIENNWYNLGFIWIGTSLKAFINHTQSGATATFSSGLTSRPNLYIGGRAGAVYTQCNIATVSIYTGAKATEANILKAEKAISKAYI